MKEKKKRVTGKDIRRFYRIFVVGSILAFVFGIWIILSMSLNPTPSYEDQQESTVTVESIRYYPSVRGVGGYRIKTTDGDIYRLSGDFNASALKEKLTGGTVITIKWHQKNFLINDILYIEEIKLNGEILSHYTNNDKSVMVFSLISGGIMFILGFIGLLFYHYRVKEEIKKLPKKYR